SARVMGGRSSGGRRGCTLENAPPRVAALGAGMRLPPVVRRDGGTDTGVPLAVAGAILRGRQRPGIRRGAMAALQAILPIFLLILLGYWIGRRPWLTSDAASGLSTLTFKLFMPLVLFTGIARANLAEGLSPHLLLAYFLPALGLFAL